MRYALSSKFVLIENTEPSGHLYEIPHVAKAAESDLHWRWNPARNRLEDGRRHST
jgi:hypothetical protein